jgi:hypothetical protein
MKTAAQLVCMLKRYYDYITGYERQSALVASARVQAGAHGGVQQVLASDCPCLYFDGYCAAVTAAGSHHKLRSVTRGDLAEPRTTTRRYEPRSYRSSGPASGTLCRYA